MTTYQHTLTVGDGEYLALTAALELMIEHASAQMASGEGAPYWAYKHHCTNVLQRLKSSPGQMTSTSSFVQPKRDM